MNQLTQQLRANHVPGNASATGVRLLTVPWALVLALLAGSAAPSAQAAQSFSLTPLWSTAPDTAYVWSSTNHTQRSIAGNPVTGHLLTVSRYPATNAAIYILDSNNGALLGQLDTNGVHLGELNFPLNVVAVASDGVIYACNLTVDSTNAPTGNNGPFRLYRWANESAAPTVAYEGDPSDTDTNIHHRRFGDSLAVRGSGANTELLAGTRVGKVVARFSTSDGFSFQHQKLDAPELQGISAMVTIAFGPSNTFWTKVENGSLTDQPLQHFSYNVGAGTAALIQSYLGIPGGPLNFDVSRNLLGVVRGIAHEFRLFRLTSSGLIQQGATIPFPGTNSNGNLTGAVAFSPDKVFAFESNNGLMAFSISTHTLVPFSLNLTAPAGQPTLTWPSAEGFLYQPQFRTSMSNAGWTNLGGATNGTGTGISVVDAPSGDTRFYRVRAD
ncbi:MAG TPA: hypothetical protein P5205_05675 [Candidatus Paceibacterota bacterium]|nr:hypothetical protein [Verrucomicrobiota bacterium]HSA09844.1 hypothetical protein [Candidatus Paceibacterota bacterium]